MSKLSEREYEGNIAWMQSMTETEKLRFIVQVLWDHERDIRMLKEDQANIISTEDHSSKKPKYR
jgi:hypothetical protein